MTDISFARPPRQSRIPLTRAALPLAVALAFAFFAVFADGFAQWNNLRALLVNNFALLAIVALAMTLAVHSGGIDLSVATAIDLASLAFVAALAAGYGVAPAIIAGLAAAGAAGIVNAFLIAVLGITPFLATLGTLFIGHSVQQLTTGGGNPLFVPFQQVPPALPFLARGDLLGLPVPVLAVLVLAALIAVLLSKSRFGRQSLTLGLQPLLALYSGIATGRVLALVYILVALIAGITGIFLSANVSAYMPFSGNVFLMNAIGATFIGTTMSASRAPNVTGTLVGVLFLAIISNGLLLIGWDFYWQKLGAGIAIILCLLISSGKARHPQ
ncbi:ABC transporter permease [Xinfangfangia sp. D13-10-4-6]|uniref:ABC transporter permease n=1 Tax=Pseudogemmobacter hezensis TaxID=2737662 RepID=UPI0015536D1A|nr:ABC transporter permease [Pseudogemmobacter hezensis]NPD16763.1 ABC transporter permease [Pseudogemmobacter hezensis]